MLISLDTDVEEKRKDISLARQQISFIVHIIGSNSLGDLGSLLSGDLGSFAHNQEAFTTSTIGNFPGHSLIILEHCITKHFNRMSISLV